MFKCLLLTVLLFITSFAYAAPDITDIKTQYDQHNYNQCLTLTTVYLNKYPQDADAWLFRAYSQYHLKNYIAAIHDFKSAVALSPNETEAWKGLVESYSQQGNFTQAKATLLRAKPYLIAVDDEWYNQKLASLAGVKGPSQAEQPIINLMNIISAVNQSLEKSAIAIQNNEPDPSTLSASTVSDIENTSQVNNNKKPPGLNLQDVKKYLDSNQLVTARNEAQRYVKHYPADPDGYFYLGLIYQKMGSWAKAYEQYLMVLRLSSLYPEARQRAINMLFSMQQDQQVILLAQQGLLLEPGNIDYQYDIANAQSHLHEYKAAIATITSIPDYQTIPRVKSLYDEINYDTGYRYISYMQVGANVSNIIVKNPDQYWSLSSAYLQYNTPNGNIGMKLNYQTRPDLDAPQYEIYAQPRFSKTNYATLAYAYANNPDLFPDQLVEAEDYQMLPGGFEISAGDTYRKLPLLYINAYTASIAKYWGSYYLQFRPTFFEASAGPSSVLYTANIQKYFSAEQFVGISLSDGTAPDLADLNTPEVIKTDYRSWMINGQVLFTKRWIVQLGVGQIRQDFGNDNIRHYTYINTGLSYRDV